MKRFLTNRAGNVAILTALLILPLVGIIGLGLNYAVASSTYAKLNQAADSAALAAVTATADVDAGRLTPSSANQSASDPGVAEGQSVGSNHFIANAGSVYHGSVPTPTVTIVRSNGAITATVTYSTSVTPAFGSLFGLSKINISGQAQAGLSA